MSYLVLARKYRPRSFTEMVGQEHVVQALTNALTQQRLHHAYLFTGTRGVGKTTVSRVLAKSLNCQGPDGQGGITAQPCGVCQACRDIDAGRFVDYTELDAASNRGVDEVQQLLEQAVYKPVQGRFKVFMIDEVHMLTNTAFNAMLKTLEEPPEYLKFVLATTDPQKVPVTVLSRCLQFNLRPMAPETIHAHLSQVLAQEGVGFEAGALHLLSRAARGSMRDALSLTDQAIAFGQGQLSQDGVRQMLGSVDSQHVLHMLQALAEGDAALGVAQVQQLQAQGHSAASTLEEMSRLLQRAAVLQAAPTGAADEADPQTPQLQALAASMPAADLQLLYSLCLHGRQELGLAPDEYAALTMVLLRWHAFRPAGAALAEKKSPLIPSARADDAPAAAPGGPTPAPSPARPAASSPLASPAPAVKPLAPSAVPASAPRSASPPAPTRPAVAAPPPPWEDLPVDAAPPSAQDEADAMNLAVATLAAAAQAPAQADAVKVRVVPVLEAPRPVAARPAQDAPLRPVPVREAPPPSTRVDRERELPPLVPTELGEFWFAQVQSLIAEERIAALVRELALQSELVAREEGRWCLHTERETLNHPSHRERLQTALQAAGVAVTLEVRIGPVQDSPSRRLAAKAAAQAQAARELIESDPRVQALMRDYDARIVAGSLQVIPKTA
ncbi:MAG: polymerase subunit tau [Pseudomonadota bacterium]